MTKAQIAAEPEVEDLLASIRRAITDEAGLSPAGATVAGGGTVISGTMRQSRVRLGEEPAGSRAGEILELRNKISTQLGRKEGEGAAPSRPAASPANGFAGILGGSAPMKPAPSRIVPPAEPLPLRESLERVELAAHPDHDTIYPAAPSHDYHDHDRHPAESRDWQPPRYPPPADLRVSRSAYHADPGMMSQDSAAAASSAFNRLAETLMARATGERPIEDITRELLRSMLKQWLDENLPSLVERMVREEIERVARRGPLR